MLNENIFLEVRYTLFAANHHVSFSWQNFSNLGGNYIRENRTALRSFDERKKLVQLEHDDMMEKFKKYLPQKCGIPPSAAIYKQFSERLRDCLMRHYMTPVSFIDEIRAKKDLATMKSIRRKLKAGKLCLRETDKGGKSVWWQCQLFWWQSDRISTGNGCLWRTTIESYRRNFTQSHSFTEWSSKEQTHNAEATDENDALSI